MHQKEAPTIHRLDIANVNVKTIIAQQL